MPGPRRRSPPACPQVSRILRKAAAERSAEEGRLLAESADLVTELQGRSRRREGLKRRQEEASSARGGRGRPRFREQLGRRAVLGGAARGGDHPGVLAGVRRPGGAAREGPGAGQRRPERQILGRLHRRGNQHGREGGGGGPQDGVRAPVIGKKSPLKQL